MSEPDPIELEASLSLQGDQVSGELRGPRGWRVDFSGWLGLIGALESARDELPDDTTLERLEDQP
jgi:hypothetical protein